MKTLIYCIILIFSSGLVFGQDRAVATVNGKEISLESFDQAYKENLLFVGPKPVTKQKVLDDMINRELGVARARRAKLDQDPVVKQKMEDVMYHAQVSKDLESKFKAITVSDREVENYYRENPEYRTAQILFRLRATPSEPEKEEALKQALKVYDTLRESPDKFAELANKFSQSAGAPNGGDMGFQPAIRYAPEYFKAIKGKKEGYITSPVRSRFGYHIIKVLALKDYANVNKAFYKKVVYDQKRDAIMEGYFADLRKSANISINKALLTK